MTSPNQQPDVLELVQALRHKFRKALATCVDFLLDVFLVWFSGLLAYWGRVALGVVWDG